MPVCHITCVPHHLRATSSVCHATSVPHHLCATPSVCHIIYVPRYFCAISPVCHATCVPHHLCHATNPHKRQPPSSQSLTLLLLGKQTKSWLRLDRNKRKSSCCIVVMWSSSLHCCIVVMWSCYSHYKFYALSMDSTAFKWDMLQSVPWARRKFVLCVV